MSNETKSNNTKKITSIVVTVIIFVIIITIAFTCCDGCGGDSKSDKEGHSEVEAWVAAKIEVENNLKSPKTASFPWSYEEYVTKINDNIFKVRAYVDSENSFGANIRTNFSCTVEFTGEDTYIVKDLQFWE